jgi:hypothetical protein
MIYLLCGVTNVATHVSLALLFDNLFLFGTLNYIHDGLDVIPNFAHFARYIYADHADAVLVLDEERHEIFRELDLFRERSFR